MTDIILIGLLAASVGVIIYLARRLGKAVSEVKNLKATIKEIKRYESVTGKPFVDNPLDNL